MDGLTGLLNWMTVDHLEPWQLLRAADEAKEDLLRQHPFLADLQPPHATSKADLYAWLIQAEGVHGETLEVSALSNWVKQDPETELLDRMELAQLRTRETPKG